LQVIDVITLQNVRCSYDSKPPQQANSRSRAAENHKLWQNLLSLQALGSSATLWLHSIANHSKQKDESQDYLQTPRNKLQRAEK